MLHYQFFFNSPRLTLTFIWSRTACKLTFVGYLLYNIFNSGYSTKVKSYILKNFNSSSSMKQKRRMNRMKRRCIKGYDFPSSLTLEDVFSKLLPYGA